MVQGIIEAPNQNHTVHAIQVTLVLALKMMTVFAIRVERVKVRAQKGIE